MTAQLLAALLWALPQIETPNGVPVKPGTAGETGPFALTPRVRIDRGRELRARGESVTDEAIAREHILWLERELTRAACASTVFNICLAWNCGLERTLSGCAPVASFDFARRVIAMLGTYQPSTRETLHEDEAGSHIQHR